MLEMVDPHLVVPTHRVVVLAKHQTNYPRQIMLWKRYRCQSDKVSFL